jgi:hypothetical protein
MLISRHVGSALVDAAAVTKSAGTALGYGGLDGCLQKSYGSL